MAMPFEDREAMLVTSPKHSDVQAHLNALLEAVVAAAGRVPLVWPPKALKDQDAFPQLHRSLQRSEIYQTAVKRLDSQLRSSFQLLERRLMSLQKQLDPMILAQSAALSRLYLDRRGEDMVPGGHKRCEPVVKPCKTHAKDLVRPPRHLNQVAKASDHTSKSLRRPLPNDPLGVGPLGPQHELRAWRVPLDLELNRIPI